MTLHLIVTCVAQKKSSRLVSILDPQINNGTVEEVFEQWQKLLNSSKIPKEKAESLYKGSLWNSYMKLWGLIRSRVEHSELWIISAGYGLINGSKKIIPYDVTFQDSKFETPSIFKKINKINSINKSPKQDVLKKWWSLHTFHREDSEIKSLSDLLIKSPKEDYFLFVLGKDYLEAISEDLLFGLDKRKFIEHIAVVSNNVNAPTPKKIKRNWLFANNKFINLPGTQSTTINSDIAIKLMMNLFKSGGLKNWSISEFNNYLMNLSSKLPNLKKYDREKKTDSEIKKFILSRIKKEHISCSKLHREYRISGMACEQKRFGQLYKEVSKSLESNVKRKNIVSCVQYSSRKTNLMFFLPENDDRVDPEYDFENEVATAFRNPYEHDAYHYELYGHLNCDGILVSKSVLEQKTHQRELAKKIGIHKYLRLPRNVPVLGDCGAFSYITEYQPPYVTKEIVEYYNNMDFDYGVSIDHLIVPAVLQKYNYYTFREGKWIKISEKTFDELVILGANVLPSKKSVKQFSLFNSDEIILVKEVEIDIQERDRRYELTLRNGINFIEIYKQKSFNYIPIGAVQGWSPQSYADMVKEYQKVGYNYVALGGLVRSKSEEIFNVIEKVNEIRKRSTKLHIFGVARSNSIKEFMKLNVNSIDNAGVLRQAWLSSTDNYYSPDFKHYSALRVPISSEKKSKLLVQSGKITEEQLKEFEKKTLDALYQYDRDEISLETVHKILLDYNKIFSLADSIIDNYYRTLKELPWKKCTCKLCRELGINIIIFRGNNRNRRRGFHNTWVYYNWLKKQN